jgi:hypothetical protein
MNANRGLRVCVVLFVLVCVLLATSVYGAETAIASRTATVDGLNLHYLTAGHGPAVILLHGYTQTSRTWRPIIPLVLKDSGHWVLEENRTKRRTP